MNTKEKIEVMQAWLDGKKIEFMHAGQRDDCWRVDEADEPEVGLPGWSWWSLPHAKELLKRYARVIEKHSPNT